MVRAAVIGVLIAVASFIGGLVLLTVSVVAMVGVEESDPAAVSSAPVPAATREVPAEEPMPTTPEEPSDDEAADQAAEKEAAAARRAERAEARAEEGKRIAAEKRAAQEEAAQDAAEKNAAAEKKAAEERKAAEEAEERKAAEEAAEKKAAEEAEKKAAEEKAAAGGLATVVAIVDGDTVDVSTGARIRIAGIDTPERGECGYEEAGARMMELARDREAVLVKAGADSIDRYGRLIRYLDVDGRDVGLTLIQEGLAIARYDSRDGYGWHHREAEYVAADAASSQAYSCPAPAGPPPPPEPAPQPQPQPFVPQPPAGGGADPQFGTCKEAIANGYGPYVVGVDPEYHWYRDADSDGIVCER